MTSPGGKKVLLFQSPNTSAGDVDPFPPSALLNTDTVQKAEQYRSSSASEDRWTVPCELESEILSMHGFCRISLCLRYMKHIGASASLAPRHPRSV